MEDVRLMSQQKKVSTADVQDAVTRSRVQTEGAFRGRGCRELVVVESLLGRKENKCDFASAGVGTGVEPEDRARAALI